MSCLPGTPCFGHTQTTYPRGCGLDPCTTFKTSTDLVFYTGPNLPCIDVHTCDNMSLILQKIDSALCGVNLVQNIIDTLINNTEIFNLFCTQIIQQCIDCDYIQDCVISTTSTSTTLHPICFGCGTYQLTNNSTYEEVVKFIDCSGITPCWTEITINAGQSLYVCACDASITSSCDVTISFISQGCSIPCVCKTYALINTQYDFDVTFNFDDCDRNPITVIVPGIFAGSPPVKICACEDSLPDRPIVQVIEVDDGCVAATCDFTFSLEIFTTTTTSSSTSSTSTTSTTTTCACERYNLAGSLNDYTYYDCNGVFHAGSTTDLTFCADVSYEPIAHSTLTLTNLGCCIDCACIEFTSSSTFPVLVNWTVCPGAPGFGNAVIPGGIGNKLRVCGKDPFTDTPGGVTWTIGNACDTSQYIFACSPCLCTEITITETNPGGSCEITYFNCYGDQVIETLTEGVYARCIQENSFSSVCTNATSSIITGTSCTDDIDCTV